MPLYANNSRIRKVFLNGIERKYLYINGVKKFERALVPIAGVPLQMHTTGAEIIVNFTASVLPVVTGGTGSFPTGSTWVGIQDDPTIPIEFNIATGYLMSGWDFNDSTAIIDLAFDWAGLTYMTSLCVNLTALKFFSAINTTGVLGAASAFNGCTSLLDVNIEDTSSMVYASQMFLNCTSLVDLPPMDLSSVTDASSFMGYSGIISVPDIDFSSVTNLSYAFDHCIYLTSVGTLITTAGLTFNGMFDTCQDLTCIKGIDTRQQTNTTNMFNGCTSLASPGLTNQGLVGGGLLWDDIYCQDDAGVVVPSAITNFAASDLQIDQITVTFTAATGTPTPTYNLYEGTTLLVTGITSGYVYNTERATIVMHVKAINIAGSTDSNTDTGTTKAPAGSTSFTSNGNFVGPRGYTQVTICQCGAGGSGGSNGLPPGVPAHVYAGGGYAGEEVSQAVAIIAGNNYSVVIGVGGASVNDDHGLAGTASSFGAVVATGGAGGTIANDDTVVYKGIGASHVGCSGTFNDGTEATQQVNAEGGLVTAYGSQASSFADGVIPNTNGNVGTGGGGGLQDASGSGGRGQCNISWS